MRKKSIAVVVVAAGKGERAQAHKQIRPKQYLLLAGKAVLTRAIEAFLALPRITFIVPVIHPDHAGYYRSLNIADPRVMEPVTGGSTRQQSVLAGLEGLVAHQPDIVLIHDAARPFTAPELIETVIDALETNDGALPALAVTDTIKRTLDGTMVASTEDRNQLFAAQTPQGFRFAPILSAHRQAPVGRQFTDDTEIAEWAGLRVGMVPGSRNNIKITHSNDFLCAEHILAGEYTMETRIGTGYDVHSLEPGEAIYLAGVRIPYHLRLKGHSDADVALHALTDAILGAIGEGDIGQHFPPSDLQWKDARSTIFLKHAGALVAKSEGRIINLDVTIICEGPRIAEYIPAMRRVIGETLGIATSRIAVKATTNEQLGFIGREEGIVAMASASIELPRVD